MNVPVRMLDEKGRGGIGNERQDSVCLRFSLYQRAILPVLSGASYEAGQSDAAFMSKHRANRISPVD